ncbi:hypothetical protein D9M68_575910 [compost metagenome]
MVQRGEVVGEGRERAERAVEVEWQVAGGFDSQRYRCRARCQGREHAGRPAGEAHQAIARDALCHMQGQAPVGRADPVGLHRTLRDLIDQPRLHQCAQSCARQLQRVGAQVPGGGDDGFRAAVHHAGSCSLAMPCSDSTESTGVTRSGSWPEAIGTMLISNDTQSW